MVAGDYSPGQLEDRMNTDSLVGDVVSQWLKHAPRKPTVIFASGVGHSLHIRDEFVKAGIKAEHIDGATPKDDRDAVLQRLATGETTVVTNCMVLTEGWDCPSVECCALVRPTKQMGLYRQMIGRVLRPSPGKTRAIVLDHAGAVHNHGKPEDHVEWTLDIDKLAECPEHKARQASGGTSMCECSQCGAMRCGGQPCPNCGYLPTRPREYQRFPMSISSRLDRPITGHHEKNSGSSTPS
jgi:DNA repair protein RadD